jgi:peptide/nickel transport system ATP-binding protein
MVDAPLLSVEGLRVAFRTTSGSVTAVDGVSFQVAQGEIVAIVGESGCGKSATALALMGLLDKRTGRISGGRVIFNGTDIVSLPQDSLRSLRGGSLAMIFQEPMTSLNPVMRIGAQIEEALGAHGRTATESAVVDLLERAGIPDAEFRARAYPHQLSGGLRQRAMIAMAIACQPRLLIADEATTALDVTVQAQILDLLRALRRDLGTSILIITHDLGVVAETADRVVVFYAGKVVEEAPVKTLFAAPAHPYTRALLAALPRIDADEAEVERPLSEIDGIVPALSAMPPGCRFAPRCKMAIDRCAIDEPPLASVAPGHSAACWRSRDVLLQEAHK